MYTHLAVVTKHLHNAHIQALAHQVLLDQGRSPHGIAASCHRRALGRAHGEVAPRHEGGPKAKEGQQDAVVVGIQHSCLEGALDLSCVCMQLSVWV